jgi:hypothetical protein
VLSPSRWKKNARKTFAKSSPTKTNPSVALPVYHTLDVKTLIYIKFWCDGRRTNEEELKKNGKKILTAFVV